MREINELLNRRWIIKGRNPELYYRLKDKYGEYKDFFREKLGYNIIINPLLIKVEKTPGVAKSWMGIKEFDSKQPYILLLILLMFLEEMDKEDQFILSQLTDFIKNNYPLEEGVDWTLFSHRKSLIKVLRFAINENLIIQNDGDDSEFSKSYDSTEVLYENTGTSKYFMRRFPFDISDIKNGSEIAELEWQNEDKDRGIIRRQRVYRRLVMEPVVYQTSADDQDYFYIKNQRGVIETDFENKLGAKFHLHRNGAFMIIPDSSQVDDCLPSRSNLSDIILQVNNEILRKVQCGELIPDLNDKITISNVAWNKIINDIYMKYKNGWTKKYRELKFNNILSEINNEMISFGFVELSHVNNQVIILPAIGKFIGDYPSDYWHKQKD